MYSRHPPHPQLSSNSAMRPSSSRQLSLSSVVSQSSSASILSSSAIRPSLSPFQSKCSAQSSSKTPIRSSSSSLQHSSCQMSSGSVVQAASSSANRSSSPSPFSISTRHEEKGVGFHISKHLKMTMFTNQRHKPQCKVFEILNWKKVKNWLVKECIVYPFTRSLSNL